MTATGDRLVALRFWKLLGVSKADRKRLSADDETVARTVARVDKLLTELSDWYDETKAAEAEK